MTDAERLADMERFYRELWVIEQLYGPGPRPEPLPLPCCMNWMFSDTEPEIRAQGWRRAREIEAELEIIERLWPEPKPQLRVNPHRAEW